ncbi:phosphate ABC transporter substrate-binding protein PstS family protein [Limosilactobacillus sp.]|jgi:phosphate transport system substrate-binding protein|uniref:phosphate ABC transporter substrate-binding protein PstS family protein n=1 Tax=Limosilactobacillus sp. TaxID=2773925 RepID=UPI0025BEE0E4|nr:phosphate ABC transporter substrate-binding protein PstS family protein [Limosilactobacillus sp.]MCH3921585.1 phosphate ABC transporter substrate-binding protein PstS family protein [Limosilactobacillus sp.]MCH3928356.1 phosphate ABC transporter substrate-binding protein PstS family protein [Limosilactobacillus sp.]
MRKVLLGILLAGVLVGLGFGWAAAKKQPAQSKVTVVGSTALQPLVEAAAEQYQQSHTKASIIVQGGGSGTGLSQVQDGAVNVGSSDIFADQQDGIDHAKLQDHIVAVAGITPIVNPRLGIDDLTLDQLRQIFTGEVTNWRQLGGPDLPITVINRASGSGTRVAFEQTVLRSGEHAVNAQEQDSNGTVKEIVANTRGAISYISFAYINSRVQPVKLSGVTPTAANVTTNQWPLWSYEHLYMKRRPDAATKSFIRFMQTRRVQDSLIKDANYISIHDMKVARTPDGQISERSR